MSTYSDCMDNDLPVPNNNGWNLLKLLVAWILFIAAVILFVYSILSIFIK